jgi:hypothetical protein
MYVSALADLTSSSFGNSKSKQHVPENSFRHPSLVFIGRRRQHQVVEHLGEADLRRVAGVAVPAAVDQGVQLPLVLVDVDVLPQLRVFLQVFEEVLILVVTLQSI